MACLSTVMAAFAALLLLTETLLSAGSLTGASLALAATLSTDTVVESVLLRSALPSESLLELSLVSLSMTSIIAGKRLLVVSPSGVMRILIVSGLSSALFNAASIEAGSAACEVSGITLSIMPVNSFERWTCRWRLAESVAQEIVSRFENLDSIVMRHRA